MSAPSPTPPARTPASASISGIINAAAVAAIEAIVPYAQGANPNWALLAATFIVVFGGTFAASLYHLQIPSPLQQVGIASLASLLTPVLDRLQTPPAAPTVVVQPAIPAPAAPAAPVPPPAVSTDAPTHV